ncbi:hypothetical protein K8Q98_01240 [Candidatus Nomurabacteria bacterium]|nr:hypothetical protein [Candidatus Nomurabacteria bacterium]
MSKKMLQDMVKVGNKKVVSKKVWRSEAEDEYIEEEVQVFHRYPNNSRYGIWFIALFSVLFLLFSFSFLFAGAKVTINPRVEELVLNQNLSAVKDGPADSLPFDLVIISGEEVKNVEGGEEKKVSVSAEGFATIYNAFSSATQKLDINTRLEGSNGKMYKTKKAITVPGMKGSTPGSVEVGIYAAEAGEAYNSGPLDFKIFGFKGTSKYTKFYAKSKDNITGGFVGNQYVIPELEKNSLSMELKTALQAKLFKKAAEQTPDGFVLFENAAYLNVDEENFTSTSGSNIVPVTFKGTLYGILFEEQALTKKIIAKAFPGEEGNDIYIQNIRNLKFSMPSITTTSSIKSVFENLKTISFNLGGNSKAVWRVDEVKLLGDILGKKKKDFNQILTGYENIISADLSLRPFWSRSLPDNNDSLKVIVTYPN